MQEPSEWREEAPVFYQLSPVQDTSGQNVIAIGSFSKTIAPGLRVGWMFAPEALIPKLAAAKQGMDTCTGGLNQRMVARFVTRGLMAAQIESWIEIYSRRQAIILDALRREFGDVEGVSWTNPAGGYFTWMSLPAWVSTEELLGLALRVGTSFIPGPVFAPNGGFSNALRLCYAAVPEAAIPKGIARLRKAYEQYREGRV